MRCRNCSQSASVISRVGLSSPACNTFSSQERSRGAASSSSINRETALLINSSADRYLPLAIFSFTARSSCCGMTTFTFGTLIQTLNFTISRQAVALAKVGRAVRRVRFLVCGESDRILAPSQRYLPFRLGARRPHRLLRHRNRLRFVSRLPRRQARSHRSPPLRITAAAPLDVRPSAFGVCCSGPEDIRDRNNQITRINSSIVIFACLSTLCRVFGKSERCIGTVTRSSPLDNCAWDPSWLPG